MDHYLDIKLMEDPEFSAPILMNALFSKLHRALVEVSQGDIAVSFPTLSGKNLGKQLRIHASRAALERLEQLPWRKGLSDYAQVSDILVVQNTSQHCLVSRVHAQSNLDSLRRRAMKRRSISYEESCLQIPEDLSKQLDFPFVQIKSQSTHQLFRLFIKQSLSPPQQAESAFSKYGLSNTATVPWF
ncbi:MULTISPECIES: type I-F CRISPR-associated endoribonuclease Cas6/Csy4 [unclassified Shewanella]|uniref:type I-F CRISPR-associated endoribonuclease Cas6/Csy4 n=1 Tax=unclassified Shewanella TaxID=196818 RepID=UPI0021D9D419|nr:MULTISPECIES: type I-F CRISPR-associated endoribonuclease Cas6/Csy4 [unclassified Shewanella]MCU8024408.1 type I-F CRISPR-associated endoribonuclease Cas6/Csy4 [Shewanella sp. SM78]MCU8078526.1 type I-F CRISPR-associated endoribonuclease Cas6/Csy4 [Shewanella sp. SM103]